MSRPNLRDLANGTISPREASHRISKAILLLFARDQYLRCVIASAQVSCLHSRPRLRSLATLGRVTIPIAVALRCPAVLVQHVFSPPARVAHLCSTAPPWPRR